LVDWVSDKIPKTYGKRIVKFFVAVYWNIILQPLRSENCNDLGSVFGIAPSFTYNRRDGAAMRVRP